MRRGFRVCGGYIRISRDRWSAFERDPILCWISIEFTITSGRQSRRFHWTESLDAGKAGHTKASGQALIAPVFAGIRKQIAAHAAQQWAGLA